LCNGLGLPGGDVDVGERCWYRWKRASFAAVLKLVGRYRLFLFSPGLLAMQTQRLPPTHVLVAIERLGFDHAGRLHLHRFDSGSICRRAVRSGDV